MFIGKILLSEESRVKVKRKRERGRGTEGASTGTRGGI